MNCENCTHRPDPVPFAVHESAMARAERAHRRLWIVVLVLIVLLAGSNGAWIWYESQMEVTETSNYEIEQDSSDGGTNYRESKSRKREHEPVRPEATPAIASAICVTAQDASRTNDGLLEQGNPCADS